MKAITITEPWATLVAIGAKRIETRSWSTDYRGPIAIHAAKGMTSADCQGSMSEPCMSVLLGAGVRGLSLLVKSAFPHTRGCVIATATLIACRPIPDDVTQDLLTAKGFPPHEFAFGGYGPGRFAWILTDVVRLDTPIPARGKLSLWDWEPPAELRGAA